MNKKMAIVNITNPATNLSNVETQVMMNVLHDALQTGVELARISDNGKSYRAMLQAQTELEIAQLEAQNSRAMKLDFQHHERRMTLINGITQLLIDNAQNMNESTVKACDFFMKLLTEVE